MDFRSFLSPVDPIVLPYFGGTRVEAADRRWKVVGDLEPGWWKFQIDGRRATAIERASPTDLSKLPAVRGHWVQGWVVASGRELGQIALPPEDEPAPLARVTARRWFSGDLLFEAMEFEDDAELEARRALEDRRPLRDVKGVVPSLRAAFGYALGLAAAADLKIHVTIRELTPIVVEIADGGIDVVRVLFDDLVEQRRLHEQLVRERLRQLALEQTAKGARVVARARDARERCDEVLADAGARMVAFRRIANGAQLEVTYTVEGARIISLVDAATLNVIDPGCCLGHAGEYRVLTLDAMPSVVREAIETGRLNIGRFY
ncbi:MAG TPA: hypothetical protein VFQ53_10940 [Kofleriaceae bacterium]|nr:hypothetical protein [Kofleriaceae bacterium]